MAIVRINGQAVPVQPEQTLLEAAEQAGLSPEYHCRQGFCGTCRARLTKGQVRYSQPPLAYCNDDEVLLCCAKHSGQSNSVEIALDDAAVLVPKS